MDVVKQNRMHPLKRRLLVLGKTLTQFAEEIDVSPQAVSEYMGGGTPHPKRIRPIAISLQMQPEDVVNLFATGQ